MEHHAYVYEGLRTLYPLLLSDARTQFHIQAAGSPDVYTGEWDTFGIDEARALTERMALKSISGRSLMVIAASVITHQAQQAFLKFSEEPTPGTTLVLLVPPGALIPTLRSRFMEYPNLLAAEPSVDGKMFLHLSREERSKEIARLVEKDEKVRDSVRQLLYGIEIALEPLIPERKDVREALGAISLVRSYVSDQGASLKLLLEHLNLMLPII